MSEPYTYEKLTNMYRYLNDKGELYFIEVREAGEWKPIGDVTFWQEDMPIVIGDARYRGRGMLCFGCRWTCFADQKTDTAREKINDKGCLNADCI